MTSPAPGTSSHPATAARRGRRRGSAASRDEILDAAKQLFAEHGFEGTSLRQVARAAGVDPAMIHHFFNGKDELFALSVELPVDPGQVLSGVDGSDPARRAELIIRAVLRLWESPAHPSLVAFLRGTLGSTAKTALMRQVINRTVISRVTAGIPGTPAEVALRGDLVATQMVGLMMVRYVIRLEPIASAAPEEIVRLVAPNVQRYLTGSLGGGGGAGSSVLR